MNSTPFKLSWQVPCFSSRGRRTGFARLQAQRPTGGAESLRVVSERGGLFFRLKSAGTVSQDQGVAKTVNVLISCRLDGCGFVNHAGIV